MRRPTPAEAVSLLAILGAQAFLLTRLLGTAATYDEDVYLAALDALRHGQALGSDVFAAQFPGFYDLLRGCSYLAGVALQPMRAALVAVTIAGTAGAFLAGRRFGGTPGGLLAASLLVIAPPLDLFGYQVLADPPALALGAISLGLACLGGPAAAVAAGAAFGAALSVKLTAVTVAPAVAYLLRRRLGPAVGGAAVVVAAVLAAHAGALGDLWTSGVTYHEHARSTPNVIAHPHRQIFHQIPASTPFLWLAVLALIVWIALLARGRGRELAPLWSWVVLSLAFLFVHRPLHDNHLIDFPFTLALAAGATLGAAAQTLPSRPRALAAAAAAALVAGGFVQQLHRVDAARTPEPAANVAAARALDRLTPPGTLTVDDRPIVSFLAHRRVVGSVVDLAYLRFETGSLDDATLERAIDRAGAVVVSRSLRSRPRTLAYVRARFTKRYDRGGVAIWIRDRQA